MRLKFGVSGEIDDFVEENDIDGDEQLSLEEYVDPQSVSNLFTSFSDCS